MRASESKRGRRQEREEARASEIQKNKVVCGRVVCVFGCVFGRKIVLRVGTWSI